jgi:hypothetical protein
MLHKLTNAKHAEEIFYSCSLNPLQRNQQSPHGTQTLPQQRTVKNRQYFPIGWQPFKTDCLHIMPAEVIHPIEHGLTYALVADLFYIALCTALDSNNTRQRSLLQP